MRKEEKQKKQIIVYIQFLLVPDTRLEAFVVFISYQVKHSCICSTDSNPKERRSTMKHLEGLYGILTKIIQRKVLFTQSSKTAIENSNKKR